MTPNEALEIIKNELPFESGVINEALEIVEQAVGKQIPQEPFNIASMTYIPACPQCKGTVITYEKCCEHCGQALDWSNEE